MCAIKKAICLMVSLSLAVFLCSCAMPMKVLGRISNPEDTVNSFFSSICSSDFNEADRYLSGVSVSMKKDIDDPFSSKLFDYLTKSYSYIISDEVIVNQLDAECKVDFTFLNLNLLSDDLKNQSTTLGQKYIAEAKEGYVEKKDKAISITDDGAKKIAEEALDIVMEKPEKYYSTQTFPIELKYTGDIWQIIMSDELFEAICGGYETDSQEGEN